jgi:hypothetical protein
MVRLQLLDAADIERVEGAHASYVLNAETVVKSC